MPSAPSLLIFFAAAAILLVISSPNYDARSVSAQRRSDLGDYAWCASCIDRRGVKETVVLPDSFSEPDAFEKHLLHLSR